MKTKKYTSKLLKEIMKKYNLEEGSKIDLKLINEIAEKEGIKLKDLTCMLQINCGTMYSLRKEKQRYTKIKFNQYNDLKNKEIIENEKIDYENFMNLQKQNNLKPYTLIRILGISRYKYKKLKQGEVTQVRIKDMRIKHIVDLIKIDLEYMEKYENGYCPISDLKKMCRRRKITLNQFLKYYSNNPKHYKINQIIIKKSDRGFYIGGECKMSKKFFKDNEEKLMKRLQRVSNKVSCIVGNKNYNDDLVQDAVVQLLEKCGNIVKKFYFDIKLLFNILMVKAKYIMLNVYRKKYKEHRNIYIDSFEDGLIDHMDILRDDTYNPELLLD